MKNTSLPGRTVHFRRKLLPSSLEKLSYCASDLFVKVSGEAGKHARAAVAVNGLARDSSTAVEGCGRAEVVAACAVGAADFVCDAARFPIAVRGKLPRALVMGIKYVPTIKDQKAGQRFQQKQHVQSKFIKPTGKPSVKKSRAK